MEEVQVQWTGGEEHCGDAGNFARQFSAKKLSDGLSRAERVLYAVGFGL